MADLTSLAIPCARERSYLYPPKEDAMEIESKLESIYQIELLMKSYCLFFDTKKPAALSDLFTENARIDYGPEVPPVVGKVKLAEMISVGARDRFEATNHQISNEIVRFESEDVAHGRSHLYAWHKYYGSDIIGHLWGGYRYKFLRTNQGWLIDELQLFATGMENFHRDTMHDFRTILD